MREILFRAKRQYNGEWIYGDLQHNGKNIPKWVEGEEIIPETVGQFTGLTDKNGKKIFEGDIVKFNNQVGTIINEYGSCGIGIDECINYKRLEVYLEDKTHNFYSGVYNDNFISLWEIGWNCNAIDGKIKELEVIGNIHDNPELLEAQK